ncbi:hypothetical protein GCM10027093_68780 [Paraburkholderia jirisanensis]
MRHDRACRPRETEGMRVLLKSYLQLGKGSSLLVRWHLDANDFSAQAALSDFVAVCCEEHIDVEMEPVDEQSSFSRDVLDEYDVILYISKTKSIHRKQLIESLADRPGKAAVYRLFDFRYSLFDLCFRIGKQELMTLNSRVLAQAKSASTITVTSSAGTNLTVRPDVLAHWTSNYGHFRAPFPGIFPCGEISTFSSAVDGVFVADGAMNMSYPFDYDSRLAGREVKLEIAQGRIIRYCTADPLVDALCKNLLAIENAGRVGEIGFGTNEGIDRFVPFRSLINERMPGFHLGFGAPVKNGSYPEWTCSLHTDFILAHPYVYFDDELVFSDGHWKLSGDQVGEADLYADAI